METRIAILRPEDRHVLERVAEGVFDRGIRPEWCEAFLGDARHHRAVALDDADVVVGMASGVHYGNPDKPAELWINEVGVSPAHRGHGLGRRLVTALLDVGRELGCAEAWVLTDRGNPAAMRMYAGCGGREVDPQPVMFQFRIEGEGCGLRA
jgi:aminoglycoside 6'-N-acetyltransferase I